mgnify:CR=1 FL=1
MSDYISREAASADECKHKIKTPFAKIIVGGTPEKPYCNILYFDPADGECHIGFGSYCLDNVFNWLAEEFEVTEPRADVRLVRHGRWGKKQGGFWEFANCSVCGQKTPTVGIPPNYCPNCGAKMDLED